MLTGRGESLWGAKSFEVRVSRINAKGHPDKTIVYRAKRGLLYSTPTEKFVSVCVCVCLCASDHSWWHQRILFLSKRCRRTHSTLLVRPTSKMSCIGLQDLRKREAEVPMLSLRVKKFRGVSYATRRVHILSYPEALKIMSTLDGDRPKAAQLFLLVSATASSWIVFLRFLCSSIRTFSSVSVFLTSLAPSKMPHNFLKGHENFFNSRQTSYQASADGRNRS